MSHFYKNYMEVFFLIFALIGIALALSAPSAFVSYLIALISGLFAGRLLYERRDNIQFPFVIIMIGFLIGYAIGVYYGSRKIVVFMFVLGAVLSYKIYEKEILKDTRF